MGPLWPHSPSCGRRSAADEVQIGERKQRKHLRAILGSLIAGQASIPIFLSGAFLLFDRAAGFLPPRPHNVAADARRRCQGWPRQRPPKAWPLHRRARRHARSVGLIASFPCCSSFCCPWVVDRGFSANVHVGCDDRISLYPAAPLRLATLLHAWTIAQVGRGSSLTRQTGWARSANPHNSHTSDPPNAPEGALEP